MKKVDHKSIAVFLLLVALYVFAFVAGCQDGKERCNEAQSIEYIYDSTEVEVDQNAIKSSLVDSSFQKPAENVVIDTAAIIEDYFSKKTFESTYRDSNIAISMQPVLWQNNLEQLSLSYKLLRPTSLISTVDKRSSIGVGGIVAVSPNFALVAPQIQWINYKKNISVGAGYDPFSKAVLVHGSYLFNLKSKKR